MSLPCCLRRLDQTTHASAVRLLFLLFFVERFHLQNSPSMYLSRPQRLVSYAVPAFPLYASVDPEISSSSLPLVARRPFRPLFLLVSYALVVQVAHAPFRVFLCKRSSPASVVPPFLHYLLLSGLCFTCYRCIPYSITSHAPLKFLFHCGTTCAFTPSHGHLPLLLRPPDLGFISSSSLHSLFDCVLRFLTLMHSSISAI